MTTEEKVEALSSPQTLPEKPSRRERMAVFGGSFDPIHNGHLFLAGELIRREVVEEVLFVPAATPPHKLDQRIAPARQRMAMIEAAIAPFPEFSVSDIEMNREGGDLSYTIDTMSLMTRLMRDKQLFFLMGMDSLRDLHIWHRAGELVSRFEFIVYPRPGIEPPNFAELAGKFGARNARKLQSYMVDFQSLPISATAVRGHAASKRSLAGMVPHGVLALIQEHGLYR